MDRENDSKSCDYLSFVRRRELMLYLSSHSALEYSLLFPRPFCPSWTTLYRDLSSVLVWRGVHNLFSANQLCFNATTAPAFLQNVTRPITYSRPPLLLLCLHPLLSRHPARTSSAPSHLRQATSAPIRLGYTFPSPLLSGEVSLDSRSISFILVGCLLEF